MTPSERALLLAVAKVSADARGGQPLWPLIAAVEAEAAPEAPDEDKSCETCRFSEGEDCTAGDGVCLPPSLKMWQHKPTEAAVCPLCANGRIFGKWTKCPRCGTGKKEKK